jgi:hypothetical protein
LTALVCVWYVLQGMLTQISSANSFPSYNVVLGFWGAYCAFSKHGRATFGLICFQLLALLLDIIFCAVNGQADNRASFQFAFTMLIFCLVAKVRSLFAYILFIDAKHLLCVYFYIRSFSLDGGTILGLTLFLRYWRCILHDRFLRQCSYERI